MLGVEDIRRLREISGGFEPIVQRVCREVCDETGVSLNALRGRSREQAIVQIRHLAMYAAHERGASLSQIGRYLGRDHTTVLHGVRAEAARREVRE